MRRQVEEDEARPLRRRLSAAYFATFALVGEPGPVILLRPEANAIIANEATMTTPNRPPQYFGPMSSLDTRLRFVDLSQWYPRGDGQAGSPTATILPILGDTNPLALLGSPSWDLGPRQVFVGPYGSLFQSSGPRIALTFTNGTKGNTYIVLVTWADTDGQSVTMPVYQTVQWDGTG